MKTVPGHLGIARCIKDWHHRNTHAQSSAWRHWKCQRRQTFSGNHPPSSLNVEHLAFRAAKRRQFATDSWPRQSLRRSVNEVDEKVGVLPSVSLKLAEVMLLDESDSLQLTSSEQSRQFEGSVSLSQSEQLPSAWSFLTYMFNRNTEK